MNALLVDDERLARQELRRLLAAHADVTVVGEAVNADDAVGRLADPSIDVVFLDIQMPGGSGFDVLERLDRVPLVVFTTAFDDYAVRAFEVHAVDYLVKPFTDRRFADMLGRARQRLQDAAAVDAARRLAALLADSPAAPLAAPLVDPDTAPPSAPAGAIEQTLVATTGRRSVVVAIRDIDWIEAHDYCALVHSGGASHLLRESIRTLEQRLAAHGFVRAHRSALVNPARVRELRRPPQGEWILVLDGGAELPVSRRQRPAVTRLFARRP
jgi:two-component system LytT family response regulator